jgi:hypothetical protein
VTTTFRARLVAIRGGGHYVVVTDAVAAAAGVKLRDRVRGTVEGVSYRSSLARYSNEFHVGVPNAIMREAGVASGAVVAITIELDPEPPPGELVPDDLAAALRAHPQAQAGFEAMAPASRREHVKHVLEAKRDDTRARRVVATVAVFAAHADEVAAKRGRAELKPSKPR